MIWFIISHITTLFGIISYGLRLLLLTYLVAPERTSTILKLFLKKLSYSFLAFIQDAPGSPVSELYQCSVAHGRLVPRI